MMPTTIPPVATTTSSRPAAAVTWNPSSASRDEATSDSPVSSETIPDATTSDGETPCSSGTPSLPTISPSAARVAIADPPAWVKNNDHPRRPNTTTAPATRAVTTNPATTSRQPPPSEVTTAAPSTAIAIDWTHGR